MYNRNDCMNIGKKEKCVVDDEPCTHTIHKRCQGFKRRAYISLTKKKERMEEKNVPIHKAIRKGEYTVYICNQATGVTASKIAENDSEVTCKNCRRAMRRAMINGGIENGNQ